LHRRRAWVKLANLPSCQFIGRERLGWTFALESRLEEQQKSYSSSWFPLRPSRPRGTQGNGLILPVNYYLFAPSNSHQRTPAQSSFRRQRESAEMRHPGYVRGPPFTGSLFCLFIRVPFFLAFITIAIWLILPVVIRSSQRLSHACLSISTLYCETANGSLYQL
jgi:hypothetical protein